MEVQTQKKIRTRFLILLTFIFALNSIFVFAEITSPLIPDTFTGSIVIDNVQAPAGTSIDLFVQGLLDSSLNTSDIGKYKIHAIGGTVGDSIEIKIFNQSVISSQRTGGNLVTKNLVLYLDRDSDGIPDSVDKLIGTGVNFTTNLNAPAFLIDNSPSIPATLSGTRAITITSEDATVVSFSFNFDAALLNIFAINITKESGGNAGYLVVQGLNLPSGLTKTVYVAKHNGTSQHVCIRDSEVASIDLVSQSCNGSGEVAVSCDGRTVSGYTCTIQASRLKVSGLRNSAVREYACTANCPSFEPPADTESPPSSNSGSDSGGSGGGGSPIFVCNYEWQCSGWSSCADNQQARSCTYTKVAQHTQATPCDVESGPPPQTKICDAAQVSDGKLTLDLENADAGQSTGNSSAKNTGKNTIAKTTSADGKDTQNTNAITGAVTGTGISGFFEKLFSTSRKQFMFQMVLLSIAVASLGIFTYQTVIKNKKNNPKK